MTVHQFTFNGVTIGQGTAYGVRSASGLESLADLRTADLAKANNHGQFRGVDYAEGRDIDLQIVVNTSDATSFAAAMQALKRAFTINTSELPFTFEIDGYGPRTLNARCRRRPIQLDPGYDVRIVDVIVSLHATDPRIYSTTTKLSSISMPTSTGGWTFPWTFPWTFGTSTGSSASLTNDGDFPAPLLVAFQGPLVNPSLTLQGTTKKIDLSVTLGTGDVLTVDTLNRTILLNGAAYQNTITTSHRWFDLQPGTSVVEFLAASGTGTCNVSFADTYI